MECKRRNIALIEYDVFGFDVDHTLAKYNIPLLFDTVNKGLAEYLINIKGYGDSLLQPFDPCFCIRGLIYDMPCGNFLKLCENGNILHASHGTSFMTDDEIKNQYGMQKHWNEFEAMIDTVNNIGDNFRIFENFFDMPIMMVCARIVDQLDQKNGSKLENYDFWADIKDAITNMYGFGQYKNHLGGFFDFWKNDTSKYLTKCSDSMKNWLQKLKKDNRKTFILTSSFSDFAVASLSYILGSDWKDYFDIVVTFAKKPSFFTADRPFLKVKDFCEKEELKILTSTNIVSQGNHKMFQQYLRELTGKDNPKVMFFGDSLRSDVFPAKKYAGWDTFLILEEMVAEQHVFESEGVIEPSCKKKRILEPTELEKKYLTSEKWGSLFTKNHKDKYMNTLWGLIIRKYADVVIPHLEYISDLSLEHKYEVFDHEVPLNLGFYPGLPKALQ